MNFEEIFESNEEMEEVHRVLEEDEMEYDPIESMTEDRIEEPPEEISDEEPKKKKFYQKWYFKIAAVLVVLTFIFNCFYTVVFISGSSMEPNFSSGNIMIGHRRYDLWRFDVVTIASIEANTILIKRVIGLPNETIEFKDNMLFVDGEYRTDPYAMGNTEDFKITLGPDEYLCLGDNRENSLDSRYYGPFDEDEIFAKINYKVYPKKMS